MSGLSDLSSVLRQDFLVHGLLAFLWLAAASAWAAGAGTLKNGCDPEVWLDQVCEKNVNINCSFQAGDFKGSFGKLNISLVSASRRSCSLFAVSGVECRL